MAEAREAQRKLQESALDAEENWTVVRHYDNETAAAEDALATAQARFARAAALRYCACYR